MFLALILALPAIAGFGGPSLPPPPPDDTAYDSTTWDGDLRAATKNALRDQFVAVAGSPYDGLLIVAKTGAPYSTISSALAVATDNDTIAVYPGTYTETLTIADHSLTIIGMGDYNTVIVTQANANVVNFGGYAGVTFRNMAFTVTAATTAISTVTGALGTATFENCHLAMTSATAIVAASQPSVGSLTAGGTLKVEGGYFTYAHTGVCGGTAIKAAFTTANAGTIRLNGLTASTIVNSGTSLTGTTFSDAATSGNAWIAKSEISVTDPDTTSVAGLAYLTGTGILHQFALNKVSATATNNTAYGFYAANTVTVSRFWHNRMLITDTAGLSYSYFIGAAATVYDEFSYISAADGASGTGTYTYVNSASDGRLNLSGDIAYGSGTVHSGDFPDFDAAESQVLNITGLPGNNVTTRLIRVYLADGDDPGADFNVNCRLSFYNSDSMTEDELIEDFYFNLTYTEVKTATWAAGATGGDLDSSAGFVAYDWFRLMGGTAESVNLASVTDADTVVVTATAGAHVVDEGICREVRILQEVPLYDADGTSEIHAKLQMLSDPGNAVGVTILVTIK